MPLELLRPAWDAPDNVSALMSTRRGGVSAAPFDSLNLRPLGQGSGAGDHESCVRENRHRFARALGARPVWLNQVHGNAVVDLATLQGHAAAPQADASVSTVPGLACAVLVADCLPVLFCTLNGRAVAAAHAGWRGLAGGVLENTVAALCVAARCESSELLAWLGPCIGPRQFEVGADVLHAFAGDEAHFVARPRADGSARWLADLPALACERLRRSGVSRLGGGQWCTVEDRQRFFSFRRDRITGRQAAAIALR
jgi:YfiH family protein